MGEAEERAAGWAEHYSGKPQLAPWLEGTTYKDWFLDGRRIQGDAMIERWNKLDWSHAWMDMGPSIAGNLGPYWHVAMPEEGTTHRLYPAVLRGKWLLVIRRAIEEAIAKASLPSPPTL